MSRIFGNIEKHAECQRLGDIGILETKLAALRAAEGEQLFTVLGGVSFDQEQPDWNIYRRIARYIFGEEQVTRVVFTPTCEQEDAWRVEANWQGGRFTGGSGRYSTTELQAFFDKATASYQGKKP